MARGNMLSAFTDFGDTQVVLDRPCSDYDGVSPLRPGMRRLLLDLLDLGYPEGGAQTRLGNAPDGAIAWQVQSMLDDFADFSALLEITQ